MIARELVRRLEIKGADGQWAEASIGQVEPGDVCRLFEPDGTLVFRKDGVAEFVADNRPNVRIREGSHDQARVVLPVKPMTKDRFNAYLDKHDVDHASFLDLALQALEEQG